MSQAEVPWVVVWGYGADIRATVQMLTVRQNGEVRRYSLDSFRHLLVAGGHTMQTAAIGHLLDKGIAVTFYDAHGMPEGVLHPAGFAGYPLRSMQKAAPVHKYAMAVVTAAYGARMRFLHELAEQKEDGLYYKGELEILTDVGRELEFLITMPEIARAFLLCKNMYYEILSRVVPEELGYHRRERPPYTDPVNALFSYGYAILSANIALAVEGAGLDPALGMLYGSVLPAGRMRSAGVLDLLETAATPMVDRAVVGMAIDGMLAGGFEVNSRCLLAEPVLREMNRRLKDSIDQRVINENVCAYAEAIQTGSSCVLRFG